MSAPTAPATPPATRSSLLLSSFASFRSELDTSQSQRERIVKLSRDITALSKQMIFSLHRVSSGRKWDEVKGEVEGKLEKLRELFARVEKEVKGEDFWRYERSISPGLQEYLEGYTFYHYLEHRTLPTLAQCQASLLPPPSPSPSSDPIPSTSTSESTTAPTTDTEMRTMEREPYVLVTAEDYLGGVADLTGELMRLAIASVGKNLNPTPTSRGGGGGEEGEGMGEIEKIGRMVREIKGEMDPLAPFARWLPKKLVVLDQSLAKIENASYNLKIRGAEYKDATKMRRGSTSDVGGTTTTTTGLEKAREGVVA
ncbi:translin family protein [Sporobolomyces salmoneus]|uniref:translin family protein n=1 Tax=Sporobolomyces salmoneus TaxID=183962 RepID=UPI0031827BA0